MPRFIDKYLALIASDNEAQGKNGHYVGMSERKHRIIRNILELSDYEVSREKLAKIVAVASDTFLGANESIAVKIDAVELLLYIVLRYDDALEQNVDVFDRIKTADYFSVTYWKSSFFGDKDIHKQGNRDKMFGVDFKLCSMGGQQNGKYKNDFTFCHVCYHSFAR